MLIADGPLSVAIVMTVFDEEEWMPELQPEFSNITPNRIKSGKISLFLIFILSLLLDGQI